MHINELPVVAVIKHEPERVKNQRPKSRSFTNCQPKSEKILRDKIV